MSTITWTGVTGGIWNTGSDWSSAPNVPTAADDILITQPGTYIIDETTAESVASVVLDAPGATLELDAPLNVAGLFELNAGRVVFNSGGSLSVGTFDLTGGLLTGRAVDITASGSIDLNGGSIIADTATLTDAAGITTLPVYGSVETGGISTPIVTNWTQTAAFAQFAPSLGTVVSIGVGLTATVAGSVSITSQEEAASAVTVSLPSTATISSPSGTVMASVPLDPISTSGAVAAAGGSSGSSTVDLAPSGTLSTANVFYPDATDAAAFTGTGSVPVTLSDTTGLVVTGPANMTIESAARADATASLQYAYAPAGFGAYYSDNTPAGVGVTTISISTGPVAFGEVTAPQTFSFSDQTTGWRSSFAPVQFNPALGRLEAINIEVTGDILASVAASNRDNTPAIVNTSQTATVSVLLPGGSAVLAAPDVNDSMNLGASDGLQAFSGSSGHTDQGLTDTATVFDQISDATDLADFLGLGTVVLPISDLGTGTLSGPANLAAQLIAQGGATVTIDYTYLPADPSTALCFCAGSRIATPDGDRPVEQLKAGDLVLNIAGQSRPISWIGVGQVLATRGRRTAATPVIVRQGALGNNMPRHDLYLTKGHALYLDGVLIPVEFLVNHRSILWDDRAQEVHVYHIELATHDVLLANGAPAESYRDDGNRWLFRNANSGWHLPLQSPCAPVVTGGAQVDAIWRRLLDLAGQRPGLPVTDDADLHVVVDGKRLDAVSRHAAAFIFRLPADRGRVRLVSRCGVPAELGVARDPRVLGVAVRRIALRQGTRFRVIEPADAALTDGFHAFEADCGLRWTDGDAALPVALFEGFAGPSELVVHVGGSTMYPVWNGDALRAAA